MKTHKHPYTANRTFRTLASLVLVVVLSTSLNIDSVLAVMSYGRVPLINTEAFDMIDDGDATANIELRFGDSTKTLFYDVALTAFIFSGRLRVRGMLSGAALTIDGAANISGTLLVKNNLTTWATLSGLNIYSARGITGTHLNVNSTIQGAGLANCTGAANKLTWLAATKKFACETDETGASSGGLTYATASGIFVKRGGSFMTGSLIVTMSTGALTTASGVNLGIGVLSIAEQGAVTYVGLSAAAGNDFRIFDTRNPAKPYTMGGAEIGVDVNEIVVAGRYVYMGLATTTNDFVIYDVSRSSTPVAVGGLDVGGGVTALAVDGHYAYVGVSTTFYIIDISNPYLPKFISSLSPGGTVNDIQVRDHFAYVALTERPGVTVIDVTNPNILKVSNLGASNPEMDADEIKLSGRYAYVINGDATNGTAQLQVFDLQDPKAPVSFGSISWVSTGNVNTLDVAGNYVFVGTDSSEIRVIDVSNGALPRFRAKLSYGSTVNRVRVFGRTLAVGLATVAGNELSLLSLPGFEASAATFGSLLSNLLSVTDSARIGNSLSVGGAIEAGMGIHATGFSTMMAGSGGYALRIVQQSQLTGALAITAYGGTAGAHITFGSGAAFDTRLFRSAANTLKTGGSFFALGTISGTNLFSTKSITGSYIHASSTFAGANLTNCTGTTNKLTWLAATKNFGCETDETGGSSGGMSYATASGIFLKRSGGTLTGGLTIRVTTADVVKTTSGTALATDFSVAGSTLLNVVSKDDALTISNGIIPGSGLGQVKGSSTQTAAAVGAGAFTIIRTDGQFITVHGNASTTGTRWDGKNTTMTSVAVSTANVGAGGIGLARIDGRWLIVNGGGATTSAIFDPYGIAAPTAGPTLTSCTATTGTNAFITSSGTYVIMCGGSGNWGIYNTRNNIYTAGTALGVSFGAGAHALQRDDGTFLVFSGGNTSSHYLYTPWGAPTGLWSNVNPIPSPPTITTGAFSIRRADGKFLIVGGAANASTVYDPRTISTGVPGTFTSLSGVVGYGPTAALGDGAGAIGRPDGKYLMTVGGGVTTTNIIDPSLNGAAQFTVGPVLTTAASAGSHAIISNTGSLRIFVGNATQTTMVYEMGHILGGPSTSTGSIYESECITSASLNSGSTLAWNTNADDYMTFQVKTGNGSCPSAVTSYKTIAPDNGRLIRPTSGDNRVQIRVIFRRPLPRFADQEWGLRRGLSQVRYRRVNKDPTLYDIAVRNTNLLRRSQFEFGNSVDSSGPVAVNIANDRNKNMQIQLISLAMYNLTQSTTSTIAHLAEGTFTRHPSLAVNAGVGTIVMKRPDGKYIVIAGRAAPNSQLYDQNAQTFTASETVPGMSTGTGALAFKRPDGKFLIVPGAGIRRSTIYDPLANTYTEGPLLTAAVGEGALPIPLPNGRVLVLHGGFTKTSSIYDPYQNIFLTGALVTNIVGRGSSAIPKPDGTWLVTTGATSSACAPATTIPIFDPYAVKFYPNTGVTHATGVGPGAFAFQLSDGNWQYLHGVGTSGCKIGVTRTSRYSMKTNRMTAGIVLPRPAGRGALGLPRPDGTMLVVYGSGAVDSGAVGGVGSIATAIYQEKEGLWTTGNDAPAGVFIAGPSLNHPVGTGALAFQRDDGKFVIISGQTSVAAAGSGAVQIYDPGWVANGFYRSENMYVPDLDTDSTLSWKTNDFGNVSAEVRTATSSLLMQTKDDRAIAAPGSKINPTSASEKWVQVEFSLKRTFPSYGGIWEDVWYNGGTSPVIPQRTIATPTISEFSINKDKNLVDLQADRLSLFRVSSNGDIFSGSKGSINTGGADLAERYLSSDDLKPGELVTIDYMSEHGVRHSRAAYQWDLLGVVSTNPGFVAGAFTPGSHPVALVGRVPVRVSLENGNINVGDRLTSSAVLGTAMKATKAGRVAGIALSGTDLSTIEPCPRDVKKMCSTIMMFVNLSDWPGPAKE